MNFENNVLYFGNINGAFSGFVCFDGLYKTPCTFECRCPIGRIELSHIEGDGKESALKFLVRLGTRQIVLTLQ